jgi:phosphoglycolate phosphatase
MAENTELPYSPAPRLLVFDLDGTLIDSVPDLATALGLALADFGLPPPPRAAVRAMLGEGQRMLVQRALLATGASPEQLEQVLVRYRQHYSEHLFDTTACYPGVAATLRRLPAAIPKAVATNKPGLWARRLTAHLGLDADLRWVLGEDDVNARKPDPAMLLTLCERAAVPPAQALMVGDSRVDLEAAQAAGMPVALCTYGYGDPETLRAARLAQPSAATPLGSGSCPYLLNSFADLLTLIPAG